MYITLAYSQEARRYFRVEEVPFSREDKGQGEGAGTRRACADVHILEMRLLPPTQGETLVS